MNKNEISNEIEKAKNEFEEGLKILAGSTNVSETTILPLSKEVRIYFNNDVYKSEDLISQPHLIFTIKDNKATFRDNLNDLEFCDEIPSLEKRLDASISLMKGIKNVFDHVSKNPEFYNSILENFEDLLNKMNKIELKSKSNRIKP